MTFKTISASIALLGLVVSTAHAGSPAPADGSPQAAAPAVQAAQATQERRAVRDSVTGKLRAPSEEELAAERTARTARGQAEPTGAIAPKVVRQHSNGMRSAVLGPEYLSTLKAERQADGKLVTRHANPADDHGSAKPTTTTRTTE
jgi:hypothetical protein